MIRLSAPLASLILGLLANPALASQPSLAVGDQDEIVVNVRGVDETFTVLRDAFDPEQWYYVPNSPRLFERSFQGKREPEFSLIGFQFADPKKAGALLEGGLLQFAATIAVPTEALPVLRAEIAKRRGAAPVPEKLNPDRIRLAALPIKSAEVHIYAPKTGELVGGAPQGEGIAPTFATQKMVFSVPLTKIGTAVYEELVKGNTGVPVVVVFKYHGLTPPARGKVKVNFKRAHEHYSSDTKFAARASWFGIFGGSADVSTKEIYDTLRDKKIIEVDFVENEGMKFADFEKLLQPILKRINDEILEASKPPEKINPAEAPKPSAGGWFSVGYSRATVRANYTVEKDETLDFKFRQSVERATVASGFIGIGQYPEPLRNKLVTLVGAGPFKSAFFVLPEVGDAAELNITQVDVTVSLRNKGGAVGDEQLRTWTPKGGWTAKGQEASKLLAFPLANLARDDAAKKQYRFVTKTTVRLPRAASVTAEVDVPAFTGDFPVAPPLENFEIVEVNAAACTWKALDKEGKSNLVQIDVELTDGVRAPFRQAIKPFAKDGKDLPPKPLFWLVPRGKGSEERALKAKISFQVGSERLPWKHSGNNLREVAPSLTITLTDEDWRKEPTK